MLKICDLLYRPNDEFAPTFKITLPATPVVEVPPPMASPVISSAPTLKMKNVGRRLSSFNGPIPSSPAPSTPSTLTKIRLTGMKPPEARSPVIPQINGFPDVVLMPPPPVPRRVLEKPKAPPVEAPPPPKQKGKHVPKSQTSGMHLADIKICRRLVKKLISKPESLLFRQPVDPVRDQAPGYVLPDLLCRSTY